MKPFYVHIKINANLFLKDPQQTRLGRKIIEHSVLLIDKIGLEQFTFKKLAAVISSSEATIYRYFENKHHLLVYLLNWYWEWMIIRIELNTMNISDASQKLKIALGIIVDTANRNTAIEFVDEDILHRIVVREGAKAYHHKLVDDDNKDGFFLPYKKLCIKISEMIDEIHPGFAYPRALASMLVESANNNLYFSRHLPRLTDIDGANSDQVLNKKIKEMLECFAFGLIGHLEPTQQISNIKMAREKYFT